MSIEGKELFERTFRTNYMNLKNTYSNQEEAAELALDFSRMTIQGRGISDADILEWSLEMYSKYQVGLDIPKTTVMYNENVEGWFSPKLVSNAFYWSRYSEYLSRIKHWQPDAVSSIDDSTNEIMKSLGNPQSNSPFDKRGLVLGYVQSGKTANFTGLINKAFDLGYKLIVVLSGIHNDLRAQTQLRLEEEVVGSAVDKEGNPVGVAQIYPNSLDNNIISTLTTVEKDISAETVGIRDFTKPTLMVVKKNKTVLENLINIIKHHQNLFNIDVPFLLIDDEADQASVDTSDPNKSEDPKTINRLIRELLELFTRKNYVGYTATPFANLLIDVEGQTQDQGLDLYPKDFLVGLPKPKEYCGPEEFFNIEEDAADPRPSLIRILSEDDLNAFKVIRKKDDADKFEEVPPQMREAMLSFLLTIAIRNLRGQRNKHNSMLIHTSRYKNVQSTIKDVVAKEFELIMQSLLYKRNSNLIEEIKNLYINDYMITTKTWPENLLNYKWEEILIELKSTVQKIKVFEVNGDSKDTLDYFKYKEEGLHVIAVGGDKLSRGLTLEGLSITYYLRNTTMYDTLMQMGRWFGYRKGYMDLCRIYTSSEIASNFEHLAIAMVELRNEFDRLAALKKTPLQYAVKMLSHPSMTLTSPLKMRNSETTYTDYKGTLQQTRIFERDTAFYVNNMSATENLVNNISGDLKTKENKNTRYFIAEKVSSEKVLEFLSEYRTYRNADKVNSSKLVNYINLANENNELTEWTVGIVEGDLSNKKGVGKFPVKIGNIQMKTAVMRGENAETYSTKDSVDIRAIVASGQEFIDLDKKEVNLKSKKNTRSKRPKERGVLLIYPLNPKVRAFSSLGIDFHESLVPIGIALSFPDSEIDDSGVYEINKTVNR
ncbi:Z1 domain-containing protein [Mesobacillus maritimus]|uniref:Z1 domain-containing protein n=1 Tax=Mesobacillus maritimus TaxID=1643336 RepID=UPI0020400414|nr:Z1 domain-containing protein [Mesobacillus maritimus]MCM3671072.1 Z1 domain-containing protein [Mesobacillus maritimus]